ncbi:unnamed protein product [Nippostrongylus brasiliensis]|uniref:PHB domain-containing protein n=1 Tax=Nippostrongylus brasiliensis TaxID=27835 RepID=A0A0N4XT88_NIPBR|nr:unnamed protein product [Nippostrongylus brasiliensis]
MLQNSKRTGFVMLNYNIYIFSESGCRIHCLQLDINDILLYNSCLHITVVRMLMYKGCTRIRASSYFSSRSINARWCKRSRVVSFDVPPQEILSKDSVTVAVDAVVYFRISNATISVTNVEDASRSTKLLAQTTLRNILGTRTLAEMLSDREAISHQMQSTLDEATDPWGVKVERVEVKDVRLPLQLQRAMAAEAEATREAGAKVHLYYVQVFF